MLSIMEFIDDTLMQDVSDDVNSFAVKKMVRCAYGLERAFENCWREDDHKRPDGKKCWISKVKRNLCDRHDLR